MRIVLSLDGQGRIWGRFKAGVQFGGIMYGIRLIPRDRGAIPSDVCCQTRVMGGQTRPCLDGLEGDFAGRFFSVDLHRSHGATRVIRLNLEFGGAGSTSCIYHGPALFRVFFGRGGRLIRAGRETVPLFAGYLER